MMGACTILAAVICTSALASSRSGKTFSFNSQGTAYEAELDRSVDPSPYDPDRFVSSGSSMTYEDKTYTSRMGVDVSYDQGDIDWEKVKKAGYEFAFIRAGYRGYGDAGNIKADENFVKNVQGAQAAGLDVGVYFFSQAVSEKEARAEADFVVKMIEDNGLSIDLPIAFDPEKVFTSDSRTSLLKDSQFTQNCLTFCKEIASRGYDTAIYSSMLWEAFTFDMSQFRGIPIWYCDYVSKPQTPYNFRFWQYSSTATVDGIPTPCDVDIELYRK